MDQLKLEKFQQIGLEPEDIQIKLNQLEKLKKFKETFDAYELATKQGYVAYEIIQEYQTAIDKLIDRSTYLRNKEDKTEFEKGILRGYHVALTMLGFLNDL
jgi:hypothetical protein